MRVSPRQRLTEERRTQILEAAVRVIGERGLAETRISDVAVRAGTSPGLVLYYFGSKDRLLTQALAFAEDRFYEHTERELARIPDAATRMLRLIDLACLPEESPDGDWTEQLLWMEMWVRAPRDPDVARNRELLDRRWRETIEAVVRDGQATGGFRPVDPAEFSLRFAALVDGLGIQVALGDPACDARRMRDLCLRVAADELGFELSRPTRARRAPRTPRKGSRRAPSTPADHRRRG